MANKRNYPIVGDHVRARREIHTIGGVIKQGSIDVITSTQFSKTYNGWYAGFKLFRGTWAIDAVAGDWELIPTMVESYFRVGDLVVASRNYLHSRANVVKGLKDKVTRVTKSASGKGYMMSLEKTSGQWSAEIREGLTWQLIRARLPDDNLESIDDGFEFLA